MKAEIATYLILIPVTTQCLAHLLNGCFFLQGRLSTVNCSLIIAQFLIQRFYYEWDYYNSETKVVYEPLISNKRNDSNDNDYH